MPTSKIKKILKSSFWLSLIFHIVVLLYLLFMLKESSPFLAADERLSQHEYVPAYTYSGSIKPSQTQPTKSGAKANSAQKPVMRQEEKRIAKIQTTEHSPTQIQLPKFAEKPVETQKTVSAASLLADSFAVMQQEQMQAMSQQDEPDPMFLVGDDSQPADPLILLIGKSLSKYFAYPRAAGELGIKGRVLVKLTLHPEGYYSDVQIVKSSNNQDLDAAALYAVNAAPKVYGVDRFISKPKRMVIGFIFN